MTPEERITRLEKALDRHIEFVGLAIAETERQIQRTAAAGEVTEERLQRLINHVDHMDRRIDKLEGRKP